MARTLPDCPTCTHMNSSCIHRGQYDLLEAHIKTNHPEIEIVDLSSLHPELAFDRSWLGGETNLETKTISIWKTGVLLHGWAMLSSVLIHEFGHIKLYEAERLHLGLEAEVKANYYGRTNLPRTLIPEFYCQHRVFALLSFTALSSWNRQQWIAEYEKWTEDMLATQQSFSQLR
jgi:hypothetical protein